MGLFRGRCSSPAAIVVLLFLVALPVTAVRAQQPPWLPEMPTADQVVKEMRGGSDRESAVRAVVALNDLASMVQFLSGAPQQGALPPAEAAKFAEYQQRAAALIAEEEAKTGGMGPCSADDDCQYYLLNRCSGAYTFSPEFRREMLDKLFSEQWQSQYGMRFGNVAGTVWQQGVTLPAGTTATLADIDRLNCADASVMSLLKAAITPAGGSGSGGGILDGVLPKIGMVGMGLVTLVAAGAGIILLIMYPLRNSRRAVIARNNREALHAFGNGDRAARENEIIDAFDSTDYTFRYSGIARGARMGCLLLIVLLIAGIAVAGIGSVLAVALLMLAWTAIGFGQMSFTMLRNIKSFSRGDLESLRFAYLAFNRGLIDNEKFHWYRFSAIYGGGRTDPAEWKFGGPFSFHKSKAGDIERARTILNDYASQNAGKDIEAQALASIQKLAIEKPQESLFQDMRRRFVEGTYWLTKGELRRTVFAPSDSPYGISFGLLDGTDTELVFSGEGSIITIAPPGAGKTQCNVFPNLLRWPGPAVVLDVKGEIYDGTSAWRAANVGPVIKFSPLDPMRSARFNPLSSIRGESLYLWEDARFLADMMIVPKAKEPFWEDKAKEILTAIVADVAFWNPPDERPMSKVLSLINRNGWDDFILRMRKNPELQTMRDEGSNLAQMDPRTLDGALQTAKASLSAWVGERIGMVTRQSDWSPLDLRGGTNPTLYVCVKPNEIEAYLSLLRVVIAQHIRALTSELPPRGAAPILFVLDELPRLRHMQPVEEALEVGRQYGIKLWMFAQSVGQMKTAYPDGEGMMGNCAVRTFMNPSLQDGTAAMLAEQIGRRSGEEHGGKDMAVRNDALVVEPAQLAGVDYKELQIVLGVGSKPAKVRKMYAYANGELKARMGALPDQPREAGSN